jgi:hypothetical protein
MDIRTTVHNTAIQATRARMNDFGTSVFQVSSHAGARPLCYPYQGKFYSWDNTAGTIELGDGSVVSYDPLNSTSYGQPAGLFGVNCGHYPIPIIAGITIPHGADNIQPEEENDKAYALSQEQRALERKIREAKRLVEMAGDSATPEDKQKVKDAQAQMREFIAKTCRTRRYDREQIGGTPQTKAPASTAPTVANNVDFGGKNASLTEAQQKTVLDTLANLQQAYPLNGNTLAFVGDFRARRGIGFDKDLEDLLDELEAEEKQHYLGVHAQFIPTRDGMAIEYIDTTNASDITARESFDMIQRAAERSPSPSFNAGYGLEADTIHEYGHALAYAFRFYGSQDPEFVELFNGLDKNEIKRQISLYAATNWNEFFAESFLQSFSPNQSELSKMAMEYLRKKMGQ